MKRHYLPLILLAFCINTACKKDNMHPFPANDPRLVWQGRTWAENTGPVSYTHLQIELPRLSSRGPLMISLQSSVGSDQSPTKIDKPINQ